MITSFGSVDGPKTDDSPVKLGGTIADRMRMLQDAGLSVGTNKRFSSPSVPTPPMSPGASRPDRHSIPAFSSLPNHLLNMGLGLPNSSAPPQHALVSPSTLGPPSPTSSPSSSPQLSHFTISEFSQTFPSIEELDEMDSFKQPTKDAPPNGHLEARSFPVLPVDPGPRPSSTPVTPTVSSFISRPASPTVHTAISKSSNFGSNRASVAPELPVTNSISPQLLHEYASLGLNVLMLDVRHRAEFERERIKSQAIVCLEPSVLLREK
jgi:ubiquitin carboxyl-terminal hydrolase 8